MKITILGPVYPFRGGIAHYTSTMAARMQEAEHTVEVISFIQQYPAWLYPGKTDREPGPDTNTVRPAYLLKPLDPLTWLRTAREIKKDRPDLLLVMWWTTFWAPACWFLVNQVQKAEVPVAYVIHNVIPHEQRFFDQFLVRLALSPARDFLVHTTQEQQKLAALLPNRRIAVCTHPIYDQFTPAGGPDREASRRQLYLPETAPLLLFFGIVRPYKGLRHLLEAVRLLHTRGVPVHLLVVGEFWEPEEEYHRLTAQSGIADCVHIVNRYIANEEIPLFFRAADLFVAPYTGGTQSGTVNIALSYGLPVIVTKPIAESIQPEILPFCQIVPPADPPSLADAISLQLEHPLMYPHGHEIARQSWQKLISAVETIHENRS